MVLEFKDTCTISRPLMVDGKVVIDKFGKQVLREVFSGKCLLREGSRTNSAITTRKDLVYLQSHEELIDVNDIIVITTKYGRVHKGVVKDSFEIDLPISHSKFTKIDVKLDSSK